MMIRINLLPVRAAKKKEMGKQILVLFAIVLVGAVVGNYMWYADRKAEFDQNASGIRQVQTKIEELKKVIGEVDKINDRKAEVEKKLGVLDNLRKGRSGPVKMMDAMALAVPKKLWLKGFVEDKGAMKISGSAISHDEVAEFMSNLSHMVWTPKGMGRLVESRKDSPTSRVELLTDAAIEEFPVSAIKSFFTNIELRDAIQKPPSGNDPNGFPIVEFNLNLSSNYAI
ncbi:PilN domain-containing protein [Hyalangium minutum]|uniref:Type IV pilus biogenesis protein PilN n=1 Tax=Hyalangium minutum TaxID=394096 RepID=A0A085W7F3_9BACT|nr:PilN domain-containing protein [Hyalangium minutum]KFE63616.1 Type IV pilus biogenesis protein PilN [Hyalangium minutum]